jgi:hypothetical protein
MDQQANESDRLAAAGLAGDSAVINDDLANTLLAIVRSAAEPEPLRARAAVSLGPALEGADMGGFEDPDDSPISERMFHNIQNSLQKLFLDTGNPKEVRRRILEASVRAPKDWHRMAIRTAYSSGDRDWMLTAVFSMRWVSGFDREIVEALNNADPEIHFEAVNAAGQREVDAAWPHIAALIDDAGTPKPLLLAAIEAAGNIHPPEALEILADLADSDDDEIAEAADDALSMAEALSDETDDDEDEDDEDESEWIN